MELAAAEVTRAGRHPANQAEDEMTTTVKVHVNGKYRATVKQNDRDPVTVEGNYKRRLRREAFLSAASGGWNIRDFRRAGSRWRRTRGLLSCRRARNSFAGFREWTRDVVSLVDPRGRVPARGPGVPWLQLGLSEAAFAYDHRAAKAADR